MKFISAMTAALTTNTNGGGLRALVRLVFVLVAVIAAFSAGFLALMAAEGRDYSLWSAIYWTVVTMSTLGFGDIVFASDAGRLYSVLVLLAGAVLILVLLPFTFIQLVYLPWRNATREAQAPRKLADNVSGHLLVTSLGPVEEALIRRAVVAGMDYAIIVADINEAVQLHEAGYRVLVGNLDSPDTYVSARAHYAAVVFTGLSDQANSNVVFTVREVAPNVKVVATSNSADAVDVLELAGATHVLRLGNVLGTAFARRILAPTARCSPISTFQDLVIAEVSAVGSPLVGKRLRDLDLRERFGISVAALLDRGTMLVAHPDLRIEERSILLLVGRQDQLDAYDEAYAPYDDPDQQRKMAPVVILGGGRVGRAAALALQDSGIDSTVVERDPTRPRAPVTYVDGDAADLDVLRRAGIDNAPAVVITTHDDDMNIFLTLYCRKLRQRIEILGRVAQDRNLTTMHRAGADFVLSYASTGATEVWNTLREGSTLVLTEGLIVFRVDMPHQLAGMSLRDTDISAQTGATVIGLLVDGDCRTTVDIDAPLPAKGQLVLIGDDTAEERFISMYVADRTRRSLTAWLRARLPTAT